jgi:hypothetical protein
MTIDFAEMARAVVRRPVMPVYPLYIMRLIRVALGKPDPAGVIAGIEKLESLGNCCYALHVVDTDGNGYRIVVEPTNRGFSSTAGSGEVR